MSQLVKKVKVGLLVVDKAFQTGLFASLAYFCIDLVFLYSQMSCIIHHVKTHSAKTISSHAETNFYHVATNSFKEHKVVVHNILGIKLCYMATRQNYQDLVLNHLGRKIFFLQNLILLTRFWFDIGGDPEDFE